MSLRLSHISSHGTCFVELDKPVWNCNFIDKLLSLLSTLASFKSRWQISPAWRSKMGPSERSPHKKWYYFRHFEGYSFWLISLHFCLSMIFCKLFSYVFFFFDCVAKTIWVPLNMAFFFKFESYLTACGRGMNSVPCTLKASDPPIAGNTEGDLLLGWNRALLMSLCMWISNKSVRCGCVCFWWLWRSSLCSLDMF